MSIGDFADRKRKLSGNLLPVAQKIVDDAEQVYLTKRDTQMIMELLDNPPAPNGKLLAAAFALSDGKK